MLVLFWLLWFRLSLHVRNHCKLTKYKTRQDKQNNQRVGVSVCLKHIAHVHM